MDDADEVVYCEACGLPHRPGVLRCEECDHLLGKAPEWEAIRAELSELKRGLFAALAVVAGMIVLNILIFGGYGYVVLVAPFGWAISRAYRYRILSAQLRRKSERMGSVARTGAGGS